MSYGYFQVFWGFSTRVCTFCSRSYIYSRPYVYCFCHIFQALRLFPALRLFRTLEYIDGAMVFPFVKFSTSRLIQGTTLYNRLLRTLILLLETRIIIEILTHPCYSTHFDWFSWKWSIFFWKKNSKMAYLNELTFSIPPILNIFFSKISSIGPWVSRIDWCEGLWCSLTYMVVRLSDISSKTGKICIFWVSRVDWCKGQQCGLTYMAVRLSDISSKMA